MRDIAILDENGVIQNIIVVDDNVPAEKFGGVELHKAQSIGETYYIPDPEPTTDEILNALLGVNA